MVDNRNKFPTCEVGSKISVDWYLEQIGMPVSVRETNWQIALISGINCRYLEEISKLASVHCVGNAWTCHRMSGLMASLCERCSIWNKFLASGELVLSPPITTSLLLPTETSMFIDVFHAFVYNLRMIHECSAWVSFGDHNRFLRCLIFTIFLFYSCHEYIIRLLS
jgi:hypothetical protein